LILYNISTELIGNIPIEIEDTNKEMIPQRIVKQEGSPRHAVGPSQERGPGTQVGDKATEEDHFAAMLAEEGMPQTMEAWQGHSLPPGQDPLPLP
jgi:hypothetical protein